jgi:hypothetical protein
MVAGPRSLSAQETSDALKRIGPPIVDLRQRETDDQLGHVQAAFGAQILFVTAKAVEAHLHHTYQKLDITKRGQLAAALADG